MPTEILMPALSPTMEEGKLAKWLVEEGQTIKAGDVIAEIETDKATMEVEASDEGKVSKLLIPAGTEGVKVNTPIAVLDGDAGGASPSAPRIANSRQAPTARGEGRGEGRPQARSCSVSAAPSPQRASATPAPRAAEPEIAPGTETVTRPCARRCATPWPRRCAATPTSS